jgi:hypothetical protein
MAGFGVNNTYAQCTWSSVTFGSGNAPAAGSSVNITTCAYAGERSTVMNCAAGESYSVTYSANAAAVVTVFDASQAVIASGSGTVIFTTPTAGTYYTQGNTAGCGSATGCNTVTIQGLGSMTCPFPDSLTFTGITGTAANINWTAGGTETTWMVEWGAAGFTPGSGTVVNVSTTPTLALSSLSSGSSYDVRIHAICGGSDTSSALTGTFSTLCQNVAPWSEDFGNNGQIPNCMTTTSTTGGPWSFGNPGFSWNQSGCSGVPTDHTGNGSGYAAMDHSSSDAGVILETDSIDVSSLTSSTLEFYYWTCATGFSPANILWVEAYNGSTWDSVAFIQEGTNGWKEYAYVIDSYVYNTNWVKLRFRAESGGSGIDYYGDQALDDISIFATPTCPKPSLLSSSNYTDTSAVLTWTENGSATNWQVEYGPTGFSQSDSTAMLSFASSNPFVLTGLNANTTYDYYVRSVCSPGDSSFWVGLNTFTTLCSSQLNGTYTVDPSIAVSASNYHTIDDFLLELDDCGVSGPVTLNVAANSGPYTGAWMINNIVGSSATNTVTINGNGNVINKDPSANYFVRMSNVFHFTINDFEFVNQTPSTSMYGIQMKDSCAYISITNSKIDIGNQHTSGAVIAASNSYTSSSSTGNNASFVTISGNELVGGYQGISLYGIGSTDYQFGHTIQNNIVRDFYYTGIQLYYQDSVLVQGNDINRVNRTLHSTTYGLNLNYTSNIDVLNNKLHSFGSTTSSCYPIYLNNSVNSAGAETRIINNAIYNVQRTGTIYGMYFLGTRDSIDIYHNTIDINTMGTSTTRGLYFTGAPNNHNLVNNIINIYGSGTGTKHGIYRNTASATFFSDYNVVNVSAAGSNNHFGYWSGNKTDKSAWVAASMLDSNSVEVDPVLANPSSGAIHPLALAADNIGTPLGITTDIDGATRSTSTPDVGAKEFTGVPGDLELTSVSLARVSDCYGTADTAFATVTKVLGTSVDLSTYPLTIVWNVTGPVNSTGNLTVSSGTIYNDSTFYFAGINMSQPGDYHVSAYIQPNATSNASANNDTVTNGYTETVLPLIEIAEDTVYLTHPNDSVKLSSTSPLFPPGGFFITERCQYAGISTGSPNPSTPWMNSDDYFEITGVPGSSLQGYTYELWTGSTKRINYTFGPEVVLGPNGTAIIGTYLGSSSTSNFFYAIPAAVDYSTSSGTSSGHIIKDPSGNIVDALAYRTYTFPAAAGVTASDWTGTTPSATSTWGIRLSGPDLNNGTGWSATNNSNRQDPNTVNANVVVPAPAAVSGLQWSLSGSNLDTNAFIWAGPFAADGNHQYNVTFTSACGTYSDSVIVAVRFTNANIAAYTNVTCNGAADGTATAGVTGGDAPYSYAWSNGDSTMMADSLGAGTYYVTVTDANSMSSTDSVTISEPLALSLSITPTATTCGLMNGELLAVVTGGTSPVSYMWSNSDSVANVTGLNSGTYYLTVTDANGCMVYDSADVQDITPPSVSITPGSNVSCNGGMDGMATAVGSGGTAPYSFLWTNNENTAIADSLTAGMQHVMIVDADGCSAIDSIAITEPTVLALTITTDSAPTCFGATNGGVTASASGGTSPYGYAWSNSGSTASLAGLGAGTFTVTITDANFCTTIDSVTLVEPALITGTDVQIACDSFVWIDGITYTASNNTAMFTVPSSGGCDSVVTLDLTVNYSSTGVDVQVACHSYTWIDGITYTASTNTPTFTVPNAAGCDSVVTLDLTINTVDVAVSVTGTTITADASGATYQWLDCDNAYAPIANETMQSFTATANGSYAVEVTENNCVDTSACVDIIGISIVESNFDDEIRLYPNPTKGVFTVDLGHEYEDITVSITNSLGQLVAKENHQHISNLKLFAQGSSGVYFVEIRSSDGKQIVLKLIKQ